MTAKWGIWAGLSVFVVMTMLLGGFASGGAVAPPVTSYNVVISESGLPSGTSWSATFESVLGSSVTSTIKFTSVSAGATYFYPSTIAGSTSTTQYVPTYSYYYVTVPNILRVSVVYQTQYYTTFGVSPSGTGSTNQGGGGWYNAGSTFPITASANPGYSFSGWVASAGITVGKTSLEATELTMGAAGTVTADFTASTYSTTFSEIGLPAATHWTVIFGGASTSGTTSSLKTSAVAPGSYSWSIASIAGGTGTEYVPYPASGSVSMPSQLSQEILFTKEYAVTFAVSGTGSVLPASGYYVAGTNLSILATSSSELFSKWTTTASKVWVGNTANAGTNATVHGSTTVTAVFKTGTICTSKCKLTFNEVGLPTGTPWGVTFGGVNYVGSGKSIALSSLSLGSYSWTAFSQIGVGKYGIAYFPVTIASGYYYLGQTTSYTIVYQPYAYVTFVTNPSSLPGGGGATAGTGWYPLHSMYPVSAYNGSQYYFSSWATSGSNVTMGSSTSASTTFTIAGPGTVTENFVQPTVTLHFVEYGLPTGTVWGVQINGAYPYYVFYTSSTNWVNVTGYAYGGYNVYPLESISAGTGTQWYSPLTSIGVTSPGQTFQSFVYQKQVYVTFVTAPTSPAGTIYTPSTNWYYVGTALPLMAYNATSGTNPTFKSWSQTTGTGTIGSTSAPSTFLTVLATGTITCTFK
jgi:List-Bact-rpt repeat protein